MRYNSNAVINFKDSSGSQVKLYAVHTSPSVATIGVYRKPQEMDLDDMMRQIYGKGSHVMTYKLRDANMAMLLEKDFAESELYKVRTVKI